MTDVSTEKDRNQGKPSWRVRRAIIFSALGYCAASAAYAQLFQSVEMVTALLPSLGWLTGGIIGSYIFGAVWDDRGRT
jgi:hypothetical protein